MGILIPSEERRRFEMGVQELTQYFAQYGAFFVFFIVLLEYLNLPGFPAGVIMPLADVYKRQLLHRENKG